MSHIDFLEKIAEGFVIEAYNSTKNADADRISLRSYNLDMLEQAINEMRGEAAPSPGAQGATAAAQSGSAGGKAVKRRLEVRAQCSTSNPAYQLTGTRSSARR